jgi:myosin heavy subunit
MKKTLLLSIVFALCNCGAERVLAGTNPAERFLDAYFMIQDADAAEAKADWKAADSKYTSALNALQEIKSQDPDWNTRVIDYRRKYCSAHLEALKSKLTAPQTRTHDVVAVQTAAPVAPVEDGRIQQLTAELQESREKIQQVERERDALRARLEEERRKPAPSDAREAQKTQDQLRALEAARDTLTAKLQEAEVKALQVETLKVALHQAQERVRQLETTRAELDAKLKEALKQTATTHPSPQIEDLLKKNEDLAGQLAVATNELTLLDQTKFALAKTTQELTASQNDLQTVRNENIRLKEWGEGVLVKQLQTERQLRAAKSSNEKSNEIIAELRKENVHLHDVSQRGPVVAVVGSDAGGTSKGEPATTAVQESGSSKLVATINAPPAPRSAPGGQSAGQLEPELAAENGRMDTIRVAPSQFGPAPAEITRLDTKYRFVVVDFSSRVMPPAGTRMTVYRDDRPIGEIELTEPMRPQFATADILKGELQVGDEAR